MVSLSLSALALSSQLPNISYFGALLRSVWSFISGLFVKRKKVWGVIFDNHSGKPIPMAAVSIYNEDERKVDSRITDKVGAYSFLVSPGEYSLKIEKAGYEFVPSILSSNIFYSNQYDGQKIQMDKYDIVKEDVPMRPDEKTFEKTQRIFKIKKILSYIFLLSGVIFSFGVLALSQSLLNYAVCGIYLLSIIISYGMNRGVAWATLTNQSGKPETFATIKIFNKDTNQLKARTITDEKGRYFLILDAGNYVIEIASVSGKIYKQNFSMKERQIFKKEVKME